MISTPFSAKFGLRVPIIQAPMAGGPSSQELVAACSAAGALDRGADRRRAELRRGKILQLALERAHGRSCGGNDYDRIIHHGSLQEILG